ncbi:MAG: hypothetical protein BWY45_02980 [Euryarchaeota archaeon ADurb.Bin294]|nr:MAG: hypothetical protein BWY45_02980 [Euryarchaeota archaeon ADurb.Bin294]
MVMIIITFTEVAQIHQLRVDDQLVSRIIFLHRDPDRSLLDQVLGGSGDDLAFDHLPADERAI